MSARLCVLRGVCLIINVIYCDLVTAKTGRKGMGRTHAQRENVEKKETQGGE